MQKTMERKNIKTIDFNCDLAQCYGVYRNCGEADFLPYVSSVNISCGFHHILLQVTAPNLPHFFH